MYTHGITFGGHPAQCAIALKNIEIMKREGIVDHVREHEDVFRAKLETLLELQIVGDVRGAGFFYALELVKDSETRQTFSADECETAPARLPLAGALRRGPDLPQPTTAATRSSRSRRRSSRPSARWTRSSASSARCSARRSGACSADSSASKPRCPPASDDGSSTGVGFRRTARVGSRSAGSAGGACSESRAEESRG